MTKVALVTGASAGLGELFARRLASAGYRLVLVARREDRLHALAKEIGNCRVLPIDLSDKDSARRIAADCKAAGDEVDLLINNAGFGLVGRFAAMDPGQIRAMIDLNCGALADLCRAFAPAMVERRSGGIVNLASTASFQPGPGMAVYFATKAFVLSFSEALHEELKPSGVSVSALCPGPTETEFGAVAGFKPKGAFEKFGMQAEPVVDAGLEGLKRNQAVVVPGIANKIGAQASRFLPRAVVRKAAGLIKL